MFNLPVDMHLLLSHLVILSVFLLDMQPSEGNSPGYSEFPKKFFVGVNFGTSFRHLCRYSCFFRRTFVNNVATRCDYQAQNTPKCICGRVFDPDPTVINRRAPWQGRENGEENEKKKGRG